ncbi:MAG: glycosyltransferase [Saprospiraceae bacterium]|nr:glycosyltransferase [Saprospiraceae bacterium]MBP7699444.1 glycosyltransferase [Saprospiraceae bacterium]
MSLPLVTIMIPTYNQELYIAQAIKSALSQDYPNLEIIVANDTSTDGTSGVVQRYISDKRLHYFCNETNIGRVANYRKTLYERATGEWVLNLDGDDYLCDASYISMAMQQLLKNQDAVLAFAEVTVFDEATKQFIPTKVHHTSSVLNGSDLFFAVAEKRRFIHHLTCLYHKATAQQIDFYRLPVISSDWESIFRLLLHGTAVYNNQTVAVWRKHAANASTLTDKNTIFKNLTFVKSVYRYAQQKGLPSMRLLRWRILLLDELLRFYLLPFYKKNKFSFLNLYLRGLYRYPINMLYLLRRFKP